MRILTPLVDEADAPLVEGGLQEDAGIFSAMTRGMLDVLPECVQVLSRDGHISFANRASIRHFQLPSANVLIGALATDLWPREERPVLANAIELAGAGKVSSFDAFLPSDAGNPRWWTVTVSPIHESGRVTSVMVSSHDITRWVVEQDALKDGRSRAVRHARVKTAEASRLQTSLDVNDTMLSEIDHRVKNGFASIAAMLRIDARKSRSDDARDALERAESRVRTMALLHEQLYRNANEGLVALKPYCTDLVVHFVNSVGRDGVQVSHNFHACKVSADAATAIGIALVELLSNAHKHGGVDGRAPDVAVSLLIGGPIGMTLEIADNGPGLAEDFDIHQGTGTGLQICHASAIKLGGDFTAGNRADGGAAFSLQFPRPS
ncbi:MAG: histidine kinase dimerization/phosphoacceptor domain -containing protein, partial [Pseudomonadota bacterium]